jgi:DNA-binding MurR/RpiR family transcriptional regulator
MKSSPQRPNRIGFDSTPEFKARLEAQAQARGFENYKSYLVALIERDRDILAQVISTSSRYIPKKEKSRS